MKGGFNNPPNPRRPADVQPNDLASMKGGFNNPPNLPAGALGPRLVVWLQ